MKRLIIGFLGMIFTASAAEYGWLMNNEINPITRRAIGNSYTSQNNAYAGLRDVTLNAGDSLTIVSVSSTVSGYAEFYREISSNEFSSLGSGNEYFFFPGGATGIVQRVTFGTSESGLVPVESRSINGPIKIIAFENQGNGRNYQYRINRSTDSDGTEKFSVSLDNDGDRVAVGYKENGTNSVVKVYQFDGSSWNQLGENIE